MMRQARRVSSLYTSLSFPPHPPSPILLYHYVRVISRPTVPTCNSLIISSTYCTSTGADAGAEFRKKLQNDLAAAMKAGDSARLSAIRLIKSKITYKDKENGKDTDYNGIAQVMHAMMTTAADTEQEMITHNRNDLAQKERNIIDTIKQYLPQQLSREEVKKEAEEVVKKLNATTPKDMGKVIEALTQALSGKAQPKMMAEVVRELLGAADKKK